MGKIDEELKTNFESDKYRLTSNLIFTTNYIKNLFTERFKTVGLSIQQFNILRILRGANDWKTMNDIKKLMVEKAPNATRLADKLLDKELIIRRRSDSDRRVVYLKISEKGLKLLEEFDHVSMETASSYLDLITEEEAKVMNELLDRLRE